jgi:hypothetical protein
LIVLGIPSAASASEIVKSRGDKPRVLLPEGKAGTILKNEDIAAIRSQGQEPGLNFRECYWQRFGRQKKALGVGILGAPPLLVLNHGSPERDLPVNSRSLIAMLAHVLKALVGINTAGALHEGRTMRTMHCALMAPPECKIVNLASSFHPFAGWPELSIE